jgi:plastocyanin
MKMKFVIGALAVGVILIAGVFSSTAAADYPGPSGSVEFAVANTTASPGDTVGWTINVLNAAGFTVADAPCAISITNQSGTSAGLVQNSDKTDANGVITGTILVGDSLGNVVISVECPVGLGASQTVSATAVVVVTPGGPSQPPGSLPNTGTGLTTEHGTTAYAQLALVLALAGSALLASGALSRSRRRQGF